METVTVLGGGMAGIAVSYHVGHDECVIYEADSHYGGHIYSSIENGFVWDDGPHVSFTKSEYVRQTWADAVGGEFEEVPAAVTNYYQGHWIDHPAQSNLYQVPEPLRSQCVESFLKARQTPETDRPKNYQEWIDRAFGEVFAEKFPAAYTRKYWTTEPINLGTDWIGKRVYYPKVEDVVQGAKGPLGRDTYWVGLWRYPSEGGFYAYVKKFVNGARIQYRKKLIRIDFGKRLMAFDDGTQASYNTLVSTLALPTLIGCAEDAPGEVREAAALLCATRLYLVRLAVNHKSVRKEPWLYIYDEDKLSTRVSIQENFAPSNAPPGKTALSVEVCGSDYTPLPKDVDATARAVQQEMIDMGLIDNDAAVISRSVKYCPWGQIVYDHNRRPALDVINAYLDRVGVVRAGRYSQWGYMMTHDCWLRGRKVAEHLRNRAELKEFDIDDE
jgi:protoporphyrinogen oxidase